MTADTSVLVAAFADWHERHEAAASAVEGVADVVAHAELEAYWVLTRLPDPHRAPAEVAAAYLQEACPGRRLVLGAASRRRLIARLAGADLTGGAAYDALIADTAAEHGLELLTCDHRAQRTYRRLGVAYQWV